MRLKRFGLLFSSLFVIALIVSTPVSAVTTYQQQHVILINGAPAPNPYSTDISFADTNNYYVAAKTTGGVYVFDAINDFYVGTLGLGSFVGVGTGTACNGRACGGPNGVLVDDQHQIWAGDGNNTVKVGTLAAGITHTIPTGGLPTLRADELGFDPADHLVAIGSDADVPRFLTFISTTTYSVVGHLAFDGTGGTPVATGLEQPAWSPVTGLFYVAVPTAGDGEVDAIDPHTFLVVHRFLLPGCGGITGLTAGPNGNLAAACSTGGYVIRASDGTILASAIPQTFPTDEVWFNPTENVYLFGITNGGLAIVDANSNLLVQRLNHTLPPGVTRCCAPAANPTNGHIYQPIPGVGIVVTFRQPAPPAPCVPSFIRRC